MYGCIRSALSSGCANEWHTHFTHWYYFHSFSDNSFSSGISAHDLRLGMVSINYFYFISFFSLVLWCLSYSFLFFFSALQLPVSTSRYRHLQMRLPSKCNFFLLNIYLPFFIFIRKSLAKRMYPRTLDAHAFNDVFLITMYPIPVIAPMKMTRFQLCALSYSYMY